MPEGEKLLDFEDQPKKRRGAGSALLEGLKGAVIGLGTQVPGGLEAIQTFQKQKQLKKLGSAYAKARGISEEAAQDALSAGLDPEDFMSVAATPEVASYTGVKEGSQVPFKVFREASKEIRSGERQTERIRESARRADLVMKGRTKIAELNVAAKSEENKKRISASLIERASMTKDPVLKQFLLDSVKILNLTGEMPEAILERGEFLDDVVEFLGGPVSDKLKAVPLRKEQKSEKSKSLDDIFK